ncbi:MAG TPA: MMPL family transporter, partial [Thermomicrobiales bacterium]|nr:MMPL family transporter [Thermomicrobiales bacterium]
MASIFSPEGLSRVSARYPWRTIGVWIVFLVIAGIYALGGLSDVLVSDMALTADFESVVGLQKIEDSPELSDAANATETILVRSHDGTTVDDPAFEEVTNTVVTAVRQLQGEWEGTPPKGPPSLRDLLSGGGEQQGAQVLNYFELRQFDRDEVDELVSKDGTVLLVPVTFAQHAGDVPIADYMDVVNQFDSERFSVTTIGTLSINEAFSQHAAEDLVQGETIGIPIALLVLVAVFGALIAPMLPLVLGIFSIGIALGIVTLIGQFGDLQLFIENMVTMLGLAIGIDYSLFIVERYREQRRLG